MAIPEMPETEIKVDTSLCITLPEGHSLPNEILLSILDILAANGEFKTLASAARTSRILYDTVIPKLYHETRFTAANQDQLCYGCTPLDEMEGHGTSRKLV
jgi:hypothetical protein